MRKFIKTLVVVVAGLLALVIVLAGILLLPPVQKSLLLRTLNQGEQTATVGDLRFSTNSLRMTDLRIDAPGFSLAVSQLQSRFSLFRWLLTRELQVESLVLSGTELTLRETEPEAPPVEPEPARAFSGLLQTTLPHLDIGTLELHGVAHLPDNTRIDWSFSGRNLSTRPGPNQIRSRIQVERDGDWPGIAVQTVIDLHFDAKGRPSQLTLENRLESLTPDPFAFLALVTAERHADGEDYRLSVFEGLKRNDKLPLLLITGTWNTQSGTVSAEAEWSLASSDFKLPEDTFPFTTEGMLQASWAPDGDWSLRTQARGQVRELDRQVDLPSEWAEIRFQALVDLSRKNEKIQISQLDLRLSEATDTSLLRLYLNEPIDLSLPLEEWAPPIRDEALAFLEIPGLPGEWVDVWLPNLTWQSSPIRARLAIRSTEEGLALLSDEPIRVDRLELSHPGGTLLQEASLRIAPAFHFHPERGYTAGIQLDLTTATEEILTLNTHWQSDSAFASGSGNLQLHGSGWSQLSDSISSFAIGLDSEWNQAPGDPRQFLVNADWTVHPTGESIAREWWPSKGRLEAQADQRETRWTMEGTVATANALDAQPEPTLRLSGDHDLSTGQLDAELVFELPTWARATLKEAVPLDKASFHTRQRIQRSTADSPLLVEGSSEAVLSLADPGDWPLQVWNLRLENRLDLSETLVVSALSAKAAPTGRDPFIRAKLLRPWSPTAEPATEPDSALLQVDLSLPAASGILPPGMVDQLSFEGIQLSVQLTPDGDGFLFHPEGDGVVDGLRLRDGSSFPTRPMQLVVRPSGFWNPERFSFNVERMQLRAGDQLPLRAEGRFQSATNPSSPQWEARVEVEGDLRELNQLLDEPLLTNLERGKLNLEWTARGPADDAIDFDGSVSLRELRADDSLTSFTIEAPLSGQWQPSLLKAQLAPRITGGRQPQELQLSLEFEPEATPQPRLRLDGKGNLIDVPALEEMARSFQTIRKNGTPATSEVVPIPAFLPLHVEGQIEIAQLVLDVPTALRDLNVRFRGDSSHLEISSLGLRVGDNGRMEATGRMDHRDSGFQLVTKASGTDIDVATLLKQINPDQVSPLRQGVGRFRAEVRGDAPELDRLIDALDGNLSLLIERGRLRPQLSPRYDGLIGGLLQLQSGALGQALGQLAGIPPGINALAQVVALLTDLPFDTLAVEMDLSREAVLKVNLFQLQSPSLFTHGDGTIENFFLSDPTAAQLNLLIRSGAKGDLRRQLEILGLLGRETNELGYQMLRDPIPLQGTIAQPDLDPVWNLLYEAARGARVGREELRRRDAERAGENGPAGDPPPPTPKPPEKGRDGIEEAVDDLRRLFRF